MSKGEIIAHRGLWSTKSEQNTLTALGNAALEGFGVETDLRDFDGEIVISHDLADGKSPRLGDFLSILDGIQYKGVLALNIKADGLAESLQQIEPHVRGKNSFYFDMSIPETTRYLKTGLNVAARISEFEVPTLKLSAQVNCWWVDAFENEWYQEKAQWELIPTSARKVLVSPELHGRDFKQSWEWAKKQIDAGQKISICTDYPAALYDFMNS